MGNPIIEQPFDPFVLESWNEGEIYRNEQYFELENGDLVLDEITTLREWFESHGTLKVAGEE